jgi:hypothetical protein
MVDLTAQLLALQLLFLLSITTMAGAAPLAPLGAPKEPMSPLEAKVWLRDIYDDAEKPARGEKRTAVVRFRPKGEVVLVVQSRPDGELEVVVHSQPGALELSDLDRMVHFCKATGFKNVKIQATVKAK